MLKGEVRRPLTVLLGLAALHLGCRGDIGGDAPAVSPESQAAVGSSALRRLSVRELENTLASVVGFVPESIDRVPPDSLGHTFDRVVNAQTVSPAHLEAFSAIAAEVSETLVGTRSLDGLVSNCPDSSVPNLVGSTVKTIDGAAFGLSPDWGVTGASDPTFGATLYAPDVEAVHTHTFETPGTYEIRFALDIDGPIDTATVTVDGQVVSTQTGLNGTAAVTTTADIAEAGSHVIRLSLETEPDNNSLAIVFQALEIEGPVGQGSAPDPGAVEACAASVVDELAPRAYRRPLTSDERAKLMGLYAELAAAFGPADALASLIEAVFSSPHFLYLVEVGEPVPGVDGYHRLGDFEIASRLSYALCEQPPDAELWGAAAAGQLQTAEQIEAQARRLFDAPCAQITVQRFFEQWLWLHELGTLTKSPEAFPAFDDALRDALLVESQRFIQGLVWEDDASLETMFGGDYGYPNATTASLYGLASADGQKTTLPAERRGILTSPGLLAVTGSFEGTSPVERGVFVLEQVLCVDLPVPPATDDIVPPPPDPNLTTRERWAQHSSDPQCASCHQRIDPIGFAFEEFDGIGRFRTEENGLPIDASGGVPELGVEDGALTGGAAVAELIASSQEINRCASRQWLRFVLGRLDIAADAETIAGSSGAFDASSLREALVSIVTRDSFIHRIEETE